MSPEQFHITISGDLGSGKSTVAHLGISRYSTGDVQRKLAAERGLSSLEFNRLSETDPEIDRLIDSGTTQFAQPGVGAIFDSRLAWHFIPGSIKIYLSVDQYVAANRVMGSDRGAVESYQSAEEARVLLRARRQSELERFRGYYGIDVDSLRNFDLVIDSTYSSAERIADLILELISTKLRPGPVVYLHPRTVLPTDSVEEWSKSLPDVSSDDLSALKDVKGSPLLELIRSDRYFYIGDGHHRTSQALKDGLEFVAGSIQYQDGELAFGKDVSEFVRTECSASKVYDWESAHGFRFASYPSHFPVAPPGS